MNARARWACWRRLCSPWAMRWRSGRTDSHRVMHWRSAPTDPWTHGSEPHATGFPPHTTSSASTSSKNRPRSRGSRKCPRPRHPTRMRRPGSPPSSSTPATPPGSMSPFGNGRCWRSSTAPPTRESSTGSARWTWRSSNRTAASSPTGTGNGCRAIREGASLASSAGSFRRRGVTWPSGGSCGRRAARSRASSPSS